MSVDSGRVQVDASLPIPDQLFRRVFFASPVCLGLCTVQEGRFVEVNDKFLELLDYSRAEVLGRTDLELGLWPDPAVRARLFETVVAGGAVLDFECGIRTKSGAVRQALVSLQRLGPEAESCLVFLTHDISERVRAEQQRRTAEKMEAVGNLAAGFAHDFNNILTVVQGYTGLLLSHGRFDPQTRRSLQQVAQAAERAAALTRQLLAFGRRQAMRPRTVDLNNLVQELADRLQVLLGEDIRLRLELSDGLPRIHADPAMLEQVLVNLTMNARDAMPQGGQFTLKSSVVIIDAESIRQHTEARTGQFVCLTAADTGCGMDAATLNHIFEPFFTTKDVGKGPGLGLATVYGIVKQHGGWTEVTSQRGQGTTFRVFLPVQSAQTPAATPLPARPAATSKHRILLVEDEPPLRSLVHSILERHGYQVTEAANGVEALRLWDQHQGQFDLLLTDMVMPEGISGRELAARLKAQKPDLKVIYTSGYTPDLLEPGLEGLCDGVNYLQKPYRPQLLTQTVRACLEGAQLVPN